MTRDEVTEAIRAARRAKKISWQQLAEALDRPLVWTTAALLGQHPLSSNEAERIVQLLSLQPDVASVLGEVPYRGALPTSVPTDPTIYRLYEVLQVYGPALKELIHEQFGDGIMSAINFKVELGRTTHDGADHVVVTLDGKFLPYAWPAPD